MTNHWIDLRNSDCVLIMGSNPAENHPVSFRWVLQAKQRGAKVVCVDPRFTKSAAHADVYARLRCGTDIAFLGGLIKYILERDLIHRDYVVSYTDASFLIKDGFAFDAARGLFSGYDPQRRAYDKSSWGYELEPAATATPAPASPPLLPRQDLTLRHPRCVYQLLKQHYARYDLQRVSEITGTPVADLEAVYATFAATGAAGKAGTIMYAMGWTQHTVGVQNIRAMSIVQLLLGNMGRAGGGVNALRGESNVQGSTDHGLLFHVLPGYLKTPLASQTTLAQYNAESTPATVGAQSVNWWSNYPKYSVSLLKSLFGDAATPDNEFGYGWLPKLEPGASYSWLNLFDEMYAGRVKGLLAWGMNPACSGANSNKTRRALSKLEWLVNVNIFPNETGWFWDDPGLGLTPEQIKTEVFVLPAAASVEKEGSISNSGRWMQWRYKAADAPGDALPDAEIVDLIFRELRALYQAEGGALPEPITRLKWDYFHHGEADPHAIAKEINGYFLRDVTVDGVSYPKGSLVPSFALLQADGSTSSGCWIYCNSYTAAGNLSARRQREPSGIGLHPEWAWAWPLNRRILYNRAAVDPRGKPWPGATPVIEWVGDRWVGDVPDGPAPPPALSPDKGRDPFIMKPDGRGALFASGLNDGPLPEHYEPLESPVKHQPFSAAMLNPAAKLWAGELDQATACGAEAYPYVCSTYRVTEHWQTGVMTRNAPWLLEAVPQVFLELSEELARERGIAAGEQLRVVSARGALTAIALPTKRLRPLRVQGRTVHQVGLPWCFGWRVPEDRSGGDSANLLTPTVGDPNTLIPESKAFLVRIEKLDLGAHPAQALPPRRRG